MDWLLSGGISFFCLKISGDKQIRSGCMKRLRHVGAKRENPDHQTGLSANSLLEESQLATIMRRLESLFTFFISRLKLFSTLQRDCLDFWLLLRFFREFLFGMFLLGFSSLQNFSLLIMGLRSVYLSGYLSQCISLSLQYGDDHQLAQRVYFCFHIPAAFIDFLFFNIFSWLFDESSFSPWLLIRQWRFVIQVLLKKNSKRGLLGARLLLLHKIGKNERKKPHFVRETLLLWNFFKGRKPQ